MGWTILVQYEGNLSVMMVARVRCMLDEGLRSFVGRMRDELNPDVA